MRSAVRAVSVAAIALFAGVIAYADTALPPSVKPGAKPAAGAAGPGDAVWRGRCTERLERARDEAARAVSLFKTGVVEAGPRERGAPGNPTSSGIVDIVQFSLFSDDGGAFVASVEPEGDLKLHATVWTQAKEQEWFFNTKMYLYRRSNGLVGTLIATKKATPPGAVATFEKTFKRAVDDCLAMGKK